MSAPTIWACPQEGCDYTAALGPATNRRMVVDHHFGTTHPGQLPPSVLTEYRAGHPEFSKDPSPDDEVTFTCLRPGCGFTHMGTPETAWNIVVGQHEEDCHPDEPIRLHPLDLGGPEFSKDPSVAYDFPPEDEVDGSGYSRRVVPPQNSDPMGHGPAGGWTIKEGSSYFILDDPPPDPDRPVDWQPRLQHYIDSLEDDDLDESTRAFFEDEPEVRCGTWLVPAAFALAAAGVVYLSYRWTNR